ncbi:nucleolar protein, putative [Acanthamoeba castellanii str. Neff]|uniref:Nucleolar protein, putative n=1 Tax=Acanthamoeba castellanii (strain ATCC 30010 / Neff) TaxID=1257118 RepID=L8H4W4_ACACF|nr:nucleolar protein, putative [Acanthamoeba castellanii str. Neff]ELR20549.1 nucleolar protein, putative [Acanthamoeba castellanii str. Neff]
MDNTTTLFLAEAANGLCLFEDRGSQAEPEALHREFRRRVRLVAFQPFRSMHQALAYQRLLSETKRRSRPYVTTSNVIIQRKDPQTFVLASDEEPREVLRGIYQHLDAFIELQRFESQLAIGDNYPIPHLASKPAEDDQFERLPDEVLLHLFSFLSSEASLAKAELNGIIRMGAMLGEQLRALEALGQQLQEWYLEHFPELKDLLPADLGRSEATRKRKTVTTAWRGGVVQALSEIVGSKKLAGSILATSVISSGRDISQAEERSMLAHAKRIVDTQKEVVGLQDDLATMAQQSAPGLAMLLDPLTVAELLRATGSLVSLAKCTWMTIARLNPVAFSLHPNDPWMEAASDEDYHQLMRVPEDSYLWQFITRQNASWASELSQWQIKRVTYLLAKLVGNAAKIDAFGAGSAQPELEAYRQRLKKRADLLLAGGHLTPTPGDMAVAGLEDDYHSDTDDEVYWGDGDVDGDGDDYDDDGQGEVYTTPVAWRSYSTSSDSSSESDESDESDDDEENSRRSGAGLEVATIWLVINSLVSMELLIYEESRRLFVMLQSPGPDQRRIVRLVEEFNGHLDPVQLSSALRLLVARAQPSRGLRGGCPPGTR